MSPLFYDLFSCSDLLCGFFTFALGRGITRGLVNLFCSFWVAIAISITLASLRLCAPVLATRLACVVHKFSLGGAEPFIFLLSLLQCTSLFHVKHLIVRFFRILTLNLARFVVVGALPLWGSLLFAFCTPLFCLPAWCVFLFAFFFNLALFQFVLCAFLYAFLTTQLYAAKVPTFPRYE